METSEKSLWQLGRGDWRAHRFAVGYSLLIVLILLYYLASSLPSLNAQVSVTAQPPVVLADSANQLTIQAQVLGALPGESTFVGWSLNDFTILNNGTPFIGNSLAFGLGGSLPGIPVTLKATSVLDPTKFAAIPIVTLQRSDFAQVRLPAAIAYHPSTKSVYVAAFVENGANVDTVILQVAPDGSQTTVTTLSKSVILKVLPYTSNGTPYLLAVDFFNSQILALDLNAKTSRRIVGGLLGPVSAALHPLTGDLYVAEQLGNQAMPQRSISVVSRSALVAAITGTQNAIFQGLPMVISGVSGVGFSADPATQTVTLLAASSSGTIYQVNLANNSATAIAGGLQQSQPMLGVESSQLGYSFMMIGSSTKVDGQGQIVSIVPQGGSQPFNSLSAYLLAGGLDTVTDLAFIPSGTPYSAAGKWVLLAASSSPTVGRGKIVRWDPDPVIPSDFFSYGDQVQPSISLSSPAAGDVLNPGAPVEVRWTYSDGNPLNPASATAPATAHVLVSTDGGNTFTSAGASYMPSGPQGNQYSLNWQVPANLAGQTIRLRVQTSGLGGNSLQATGTADLSVLDMPSGLPQTLSANPNFVIQGQSATINIDGLNFQGVTSVNLGDDVPLSSLQTISSSSIQAQFQSAASAATGPRSILACSPAACQQSQNEFFVLSPDGPQITSLSPVSGTPGTTVVITGSNFDGNRANNIVSFGNLTATVSQATPTQLTVQVPFGLNRGELPVSVQTNGVASNTAAFLLAPPGFIVPIVNSNGVVNGASFSPGSTPVASGSIISLFGASMVSSIASAPSVPLPTQLLNGTVVIGGIPAPLFFVAPNQINAQVPEEMAGLSSVPVSILNQGVAGNTVLLNLAPQSPGIFSQASNGRGPGAVLNQDYSLNGINNPEHIGNTLQVFGTGLGQANPPVPTGVGAPGNPVSNVNPPQATIDGVPATVTFAGRAPGFVGLDQVNVVIPTGVSTSRPVSLVLTAGANASNSVTVVVVP